jgi:hypothetical protein
MVLSSAIISLDLGPGMGVLTLGPEGSPSMRFDRHLAFCGSCLKRLDLVVNVFNLLRAIVYDNSEQFEMADEKQVTTCTAAATKTIDNQMRIRTRRYMVNKPRHYAGLPSVKSQYLCVILILYLNSNSSRLLPCVVTVPGYDPIVEHDVCRYTTNQ